MSNPNIYKHKSNGVEVLTHEGPDALYELLDYIEDNFPDQQAREGVSTSDIPALQWESEMQRASLDHVNDHGPKNLTGHKGSDGSKPFERLARYGHCPGLSGENLAYGNFEPIHIVL